MRGAGNLIILRYKNPRIGFIVLMSSYSPVTYMTDYSIFYAFWHVCAHCSCPRQSHILIAHFNSEMYMQAMLQEYFLSLTYIVSSYLLVLMLCKLAKLQIWLWIYVSTISVYTVVLTRGKRNVRNLQPLTATHENSGLFSVRQLCLKGKISSHYFMRPLQFSVFVRTYSPYLS